MRAQIEITIIENGYLCVFGDKRAVFFTTTEELHAAIEKYKERIKPLSKKKGSED